MAKNTTHTLTVVPRGIATVTNGEAAPTGTAREAQNVREHEQCLAVTGRPVAVGRVGAGEHLLLADEGRLLSVDDNGTVRVDGHRLLTVTPPVVGAYRLDRMVAVVTRDATRWLVAGDDGYTPVDPAEALPGITLGRGTVARHTMLLEAYDFERPLTRWSAPLPAGDEAALTRQLRAARKALEADIADLGRHSRPMLARYGLRLSDGHYLCLSAPVRLGDDVGALNSGRLAVDAVTGGDTFTGVPAATAALSSWGLTVEVGSGIPEAWRPLVAAVDILTTPEADVVNSDGRLDYRMFTTTTGERRYVLEMGWRVRDNAAVTATLNASPWRVVATSTALDDLTPASFTVPPTARTLTPAEAAAVDRGAAGLTRVVAATAVDGCLWRCTADGVLTVTVPRQPLVEAQRVTVAGATVRALAAVRRPLYNGAFGRYPLYVFTDSGTYALSQSTSGTLGTLRLLSRDIIAPGTVPVEAGGGVCLVDRHGRVLRVSGATVDTVLPAGAARWLAWDDQRDELWVLPGDGDYPTVVMSGGRRSRRTVALSELWASGTQALGVTPDGAVLDLTREEPVEDQSFVYRSQAVALGPVVARRVVEAVWRLDGGPVAARLTVRGERGTSCHGMALGTLTVRGHVSPPLRHRLWSAAVRTVAVDMAGTAPSGTLLHPVTLLHTT